MSASHSSTTLPLEVRQQLWTRLWREVLLRPRNPVPPPREARRDDASAGAIDNGAA